MKIIRLIPFILIFIGTFSLIATELFVALEAYSSRCFTLTFAALNVLGLIMLVLTHKRS